MYHLQHSQNMYVFLSYSKPSARRTNIFPYISDHLLFPPLGSPPPFSHPLSIRIFLSSSKKFELSMKMRQILLKYLNDLVAGCQRCFTKKNCYVFSLSPSKTCSLALSFAHSNSHPSVSLFLSPSLSLSLCICRSVSLSLSLSLFRALALVPRYLSLSFDLSMHVCTCTYCSST